MVLRTEDAAAIETVSAAILAAVRAPIELADGVEVRIGVSIGAAGFAADGHDPAALFARADAALYGAKRSGGGRMGHA